MVRYVVTDTGDGIETILSRLDKATYRIIDRKDFSHSLVREQEGMSSDADIIVFITQDVRIERDDWLAKLIQPIINGECEASYSRQICTEDIIEKYIREINYPAQSVIKTNDSISAMGINTFFFSDVSSAIRRDIFVKLNGYDGKWMPTNEDMYFAHKLITNGYRIKYCADSEVIHYHNYTFKQLYKRYYDSGKFFKDNAYLNQYKTTSAGGSLAKYVLKRALQEKNYAVLARFIPDMAARYIGMKAGQIL